MFCAKCGKELPDNSQFCTVCGTPVKSSIVLRCKECNGTMEVDKEQQILSCPYCGSKELIVESDQVSIERIRSNTYKDIETMKFQHEAQKDKISMEKEEINSFKKGKFSKVIIVFAVISVILAMSRFTFDGVLNKLLGIMALAQAGIFIVAWLMGAKVIKIGKHGYYVIAAIIGFILFIPMFMVPTNYRRYDYERESKEYKEIKWPDSEIAKLLPVPESNIGEIIRDSEDGFFIYIANTSSKQFDTYIEVCKEKGFIVDYNRSDHRYSANNESGIQLILSYDDDERVMDIRVSKPDESNPSEEPKPTEKPIETEAPSETQDTVANQQSEEPVIGDALSPEFKEAMDSYEAFFDEYIAFMKKYQESDNVTSMLSDYADYLSKYSETMEKMEKLKNDLSAAELIYYEEVNARIMKKLNEAAQ